MDEKNNHPLRSRTAGRAAPLLGAILALCLAAACDRTSGSGSSDPETSSQSKGVPLYTIRGTIDLESDTDPTGTAVFCAGTSHVAFTDSSGNYVISSIPPGSYRLVAQRPNFQTATLGDVILEADPESDDALETTVPPRKLALLAPSQLLPAGRPALAAVDLGSLTGRVFLSDGQPPVNVRVRIGQTNLTAKPDDTGVFTIRNIPPGVYLVYFEQEGYYPSSPKVAIADGANRMNVPMEMVPIGPGPTDSLSILGSVLFLGYDGLAVDKTDAVRVRIVENQKETFASETGVFLFDNMAPGEYTLTAQAAGFTLRQEVKVNLRVASAEVILILQENKGGVIGIVQLDGNETLAGTQISLLNTTFSGLTDLKGAFTLPAIPVGTYKVLYFRNDFLPLEIPGIEIAAGEVVDLGTLKLVKDVDYPKVLSFDPPDGARDLTILPVNVLRVRFSKRMNLNSVEQAFAISPACSYTIRRPQSSALSDSKTDMVEIHVQNGRSPNPLSFNTNYTVSISAVAADVDGNILDTDFSSSFRTGGLKIISSYPPIGAQNVPVEQHNRLTAFFNGLVDRKTISERNVDISPRPQAKSPLMGLTVDAATGWTVFRLPVSWAYDTKYTIRFSGSIRTTGGVSLSPSPFRIQFSTAPQPKLRR